MICAQCRRTVKKKDTLEVIDIKDSHKKKRLCRDCQLNFYIDEAKNRGMKVGVYGKFSEDQIKQGEHNQIKWAKDIKNGR